MVTRKIHELLLGSNHILCKSPIFTIETTDIYQAWGRSRDHKAPFLLPDNELVKGPEDYANYLALSLALGPSSSMALSITIKEAWAVIREMGLGASRTYGEAAMDGDPGGKALAKAHEALAAAKEGIVREIVSTLHSISTTEATRRIITQRLTALSLFTKPDTRETIHRENWVRAGGHYFTVLGLYSWLGYLVRDLETVQRRARAPFGLVCIDASPLFSLLRFSNDPESSIVTPLVNYMKQCRKYGIRLHLHTAWPWQRGHRYLEAFSADSEVVEGGSLALMGKVVINVHGPSGIGKTQLALRLFTQLMDTIYMAPSKYDVELVRGLKGEGVEVTEAPLIGGKAPLLYTVPVDYVPALLDFTLPQRALYYYALSMANPRRIPKLPFTKSELVSFLKVCHGVSWVHGETVEAVARSIQFLTSTLERQAAFDEELPRKGSSGECVREGKRRIYCAVPYTFNESELRILMRLMPLARGGAVVIDDADLWGTEESWAELIYFGKWGVGAVVLVTHRPLGFGIRIEVTSPVKGRVGAKEYRVDVPREALRMAKVLLGKHGYWLMLRH